MMKFFSREFCERLLRLGCKSENSSFWCLEEKLQDMPNYWVEIHRSEKPEYLYPMVPCFSQNDFTGCHEQARENAKIVWGDACHEKPCHTGDDDRPHDWVWVNHRHAMIDATDADEYLKETMK